MTARIIMKLDVVGREPAGDGTIRLTFKHPKRDTLPEWTPGAHVDVRLPDGKIRQYSLIGDHRRRDVYVVAVKDEVNGRGGSRWIHQALIPGGRAHVAAPRNNFSLADHHGRTILIAGGIGVTPLVSMARALAERHADFVLHYCSRTEQASLLDDLRAICGERLQLHVSGGSRFDAASMLEREDSSSTQIYCCGPERLTASVRAATESWPPDAVHFEIFQPTLDENFKPEPFDLTIASSGQTIRIPADRSALDVLRDNGFILPSSCELGVCGSCECGYRDGIVIHRDSVLNLSARQDRMMLCVSRARVSVTVDL